MLPIASAAPQPGAAAPPSTPRQKRIAKQQRQHQLQLEARRQQHRSELKQQGQPQQSTPPLPPPPPLPARAGLQLECRHFAACSGCTLDSGLDQPPILEEAQRFFAEECEHVGFSLTWGSAQRWRHRARLAVRPGAGGRAVVGLFAEGSHTAIDIPACVVHHPVINQAVQLLQAAIAECGIQPYDEAAGSGELRYVQLTVVEPSGHSSRHGSTAPTPAAAGASTPAGAAAAGTGATAVQLALVWNAHASEAAADGSAAGARLQALADRLWQLGKERQQRQRSEGFEGPAGAADDSSSSSGGGSLLHSVWANFQPARSNTILGPEWRLLRGEEWAWARLGGADICFGPGSFLQANPWAMVQALAAMQRHVPPGSTIADLHAGVGTIGLSLAATRQPRWVRFVEISGHGLPPFHLSAARLRERVEAAARDAAIDSGGNGSDSGGSSDSHGSGASHGSSEAAAPHLEYFVAAAGSDPGRWCQGAEIVVLDPPRKGLEPSLLSWLCSPSAAGTGVRRLLYLSCGFPALRRDCSALLGSGRWRLAHAEAFLFFPGGDHIETLCVFDACGP